MSKIKSFFNRLWFDFIVNSVASNLLIPKQVRYYLYKSAGINIKTNSIRSRVYFHSKEVTVGKGSFINSFSKIFSSIVDGGTVTIGDNCYLAMNVTLITHTHKIGDPSKRCGEDEYYPILIKDGCWLGANVTVLPGVTINEGCIIAAGAVVTKDCKPNGLYAGVPAKRIKDLPIGG